MTAEASLALDRASLFTGDGPPIADASVVFAGGRIVHAGTGTRPARRRIDLNGAAVLPGLIDLHVHVGAFTDDIATLDASDRQTEYRMHRPRARRALLEAGVTTIRSVGDLDEPILQLRHAIARGSLAGPRVFCAGPVFTAPGGHPISTIYAAAPELACRGARAIATHEQAQQALAQLIAADVDGIKVVYSGVPRLAPDLFETIARATLQHGRWLAVHTSTLADVKAAVLVGATTVEHGVTSGERLDDEVITAMRTRGTTYVPTLQVLARRASDRLDRALENVRIAHRAGVSIGAGSDAQGPGSSFRSALANELELLVEAGLTPVEALASATRNAARALGHPELGTVAVNTPGDVVVVDGRPWERIDHVRNMRLVIRDGEIVAGSEM